LPEEKSQELEPWDLKACSPYDDSYLAGFSAESYTIDLGQGFEIARGIMEEAIRQTVRRDIGGDEQRITSMDTRYSDLTFKHILLPVWISAYRYAEKTYRFLVNARTGEVQGERPYSAVKIALAVIAGLIVAAVIAYFASRR
jgi:hypothetical protein